MDGQMTYGFLLYYNTLKGLSVWVILLYREFVAWILNAALTSPAVKTGDIDTGGNIMKRTLSLAIFIGAATLATGAIAASHAGTGRNHPSAPKIRQAGPT